MRRNQSINLPMSRILSATNTAGLVAALTGTTDDAVLSFAAGVVVAGEGIAVSDTAAAGTVISITSPGIYQCEVGIGVGVGTVISGMSINGNAASLAAAPSFANAGVLDVLTTTAPAATAIFVKTVTTVLVRRSAAGTAGGALLRFLATDGAGAAPAAVVQATAYYRVTKTAEVYF